MNVLHLTKMKNRVWRSGFTSGRRKHMSMSVTAGERGEFIVVVRSNAVVRYYNGQDSVGKSHTAALLDGDEALPVDVIA